MLRNPTLLPPLSIWYGLSPYLNTKWLIGMTALSSLYIWMDVKEESGQRGRGESGAGVRFTTWLPLQEVLALTASSPSLHSSNPVIEVASIWS